MSRQPKNNKKDECEALIHVYRLARKKQKKSLEAKRKDRIKLICDFFGVFFDCCKGKCKDKPDKDKVGEDDDYTNAENLDGTVHKEDQFDIIYNMVYHKEKCIDSDEDKQEETSSQLKEDEDDENCMTCNGILRFLSAVRTAITVIIVFEIGNTIKRTLYMYD